MVGSESSSEKKCKENKYKKRTSIGYAEYAVQKVFQEINCGTLTSYSAAKIYGIPRTTLQYHLSDGFKHKGSLGPYTVFTLTEEEEIVTWLKDNERSGNITYSE